MSNANTTTATGGSAYPGFETPHERVAKVLRTCGADITPMGRGRWRLRDRNPDNGVCNAALEGEWLALSKPISKASIPAPGLVAPLQLLQRNAGLAAGVRYALVDDRISVQLRADIPWKALRAHHPGLLAARIDQALLGFAGAPACAPACARDAPEGIAREAASNDDANDFDSRLTTLCDEAGWPVSRKGAGGTRVEVALRDGYGVVAITRAGAGTSFGADLGCADLPADDSDSGRAIGFLLLLVTGGVRMCRPVLRNHQDRPVLQLEAVFGGQPMVAGEVDCALGALSVAVEECAREVELLSANPHLARAYLDTWKMRRGKTRLARRREQR